MVLTDDEIKIIKALFCKQDLNGDDYITLSDFRGILNEQFCDDEINIMLNDGDINTDNNTGIDSCISSCEK